MRGNLSVRINDGTTDRLVTSKARGLSFTKVAPGGHQSAKVRLDLPRDTFRDLGPSDRFWIYDTRTSRCIFSGYTDNPTPVDGPGGQAFDLTATGAMIRASDETRVLIYVDQSLDGWQPEPNSSTAGEINDVKAPVTPGKRLMFSGGSLAVNGALVAVGYRRIGDAGMSIGGVRVYSGSGEDDTGYRLELFADGAGSGLFLVGDSGKITTVPLDQSFYPGESYIRSPDAALQPFSGTRLAFQLRRVGATTNVAGDLTYSDIVGLSVIGQRMDRTGTLYTGAAALAPATSVYAHQVVEDVLGRLLTFCDPLTSLVEPTYTAIDQLAWPDGATAQRVLDELGQFESTMTWEILEDAPGRGHRAAYRVWPTVPRFEIDTRDGYAEVGSDNDLCNRVLVKWTDFDGTPRQLEVTASSADYPALAGLEAAGRIHDADPITLPDGKGSEANALITGTQALAALAVPPRSAKATVRRRIRDLWTGGLIDPWEIEPGYLVRVRDLGITLRLTEMTYDDDTCSASLSLGDPVLTTEQRLLRLAKVA